VDPFVKYVLHHLAVVGAEVVHVDHRFSSDFLYKLLDKVGKGLRIVRFIEYGVVDQTLLLTYTSDD
jgi:hypothetical protein